MKSALTEKEDCKRELEIELPIEDWKKEADELALEFAKHARVPGFRPGRVPVAIIKQRFRGEIRSELLKNLLPKAIEQAAAENGVTPITNPEVHDLVLDDNKPLTFKADFEILPPVEIPNYKGLNAIEERVTVRDEEVEEMLVQLREQAAEFLVVEGRPVQEGDFVSVSFSAYPTRKSDEKPEKAFQAKDLLIEVGNERTVKEFTENLVGKTIGEEVHFTVDYPDDFADKRLAGRRVSYQVNMEALKTKSLPEIDDGFAKTLGEFDTLVELKAKIRSDLEANKRTRSKEQTCEKLLDQIIEQNPFPAPLALVEAQIDSRMQGMLRSLYQQGVRADQLSIDWAKLREEHRPAAVRDVKATLILEHIAKKESIAVNDQETDAEITRIAERTHESFSAVKQHLTKQGSVDKLRSQLNRQRVLNFLYDHADISTGSTQLDKQTTSS